MKHRDACDASDHSMADTLATVELFGGSERLTARPLTLPRPLSALAATTSRRGRRTCWPAPCARARTRAQARRPCSACRSWRRRWSATSPRWRHAWSRSPRRRWCTCWRDSRRVVGRGDGMGLCPTAFELLCAVTHAACLSIPFTSRHLTSPHLTRHGPTSPPTGRGAWPPPLRIPGERPPRQRRGRHGPRQAPRGPGVRLQEPLRHGPPLAPVVLILTPELRAMPCPASRKPGDATRGCLPTCAPHTLS